MHMIRKIKVLCCCLAALAAFVILPGPVSAYTTVGTELILLADVSGSLDATDFALQRNGYVAAFRDPNVISKIASQTGGIAVTLVYWSSGQSQTIGWTHIYDAATSNAFANAIEAATRPSSGSTNMAAAMNFAGGLIDNQFIRTYQVVDVSGDGANRDGVQSDPDVQNARDNLVNNFGVDMINALWIDDRYFFGDDPGDYVQAVPYGIENVIYGPGSFSWIVDDYTEFEAAVKNKIYAEITPNPVPIPAAVWLFGSGLLGFLGFRKRFTK